MASLALSTKRASGDDCPPALLDKILGEVAQARGSLTTLRGPFTQERTIGLLSAKVISTGTLTLVRPDRLRWELAPPDDAVYWILPEGLAYKNKTGQGRVARAGDKIAAALDDLRVVLGGDLARLRVRYDLHAHCDDPNALDFSAVPKPGQVTAASRIDFSLAQDKVSPRNATLVFGPRDKTQITFGPMQKNMVVDPAVMRPPV
jgi:hypothetical protein